MKKKMCEEPKGCTASFIETLEGSDHFKPSLINGRGLCRCALSSEYLSRRIRIREGELHLAWTDGYIRD